MSELYEAAIEIRESINYLAKKVEEFHTGDTLRVRINHSHTLKDGWRLSETTVEWMGQGDPHKSKIHLALMDAHEMGWQEAQRRNNAEAARAAKATAEESS